MVSHTDSNRYVFHVSFLCSYDFRLNFFRFLVFFGFFQDSFTDNHWSIWLISVVLMRVFACFDNIIGPFVVSLYQSLWKTSFHANISCYSVLNNDYWLTYHDAGNDEDINDFYGLIFVIFEICHFEHIKVSDQFDFDYFSKPNWRYWHWQRSYSNHTFSRLIPQHYSFLQTWQSVPWNHLFSTSYNFHDTLVHLHNSFPFDTKLWVLFPWLRSYHSEPHYFLTVWRKTRCWPFPFVSKIRLWNCFSLLLGLFGSCLGSETCC